LGKMRRHTAQDGSKSSHSKNIKAEIEYRKRLSQQHLGIQHWFDDHKNSLDEVFPSWIEPQIRWFDDLFPRLKEGRQIDRFLEVGAEKGHIGIHLRNRYGIKGVCTDLSVDTFHMATPIVQERMGVREMPPLASADVHALPFRDDSFDLVFCFSSLHHFHSPHDALGEIKRVLRGEGIFFCSWEPMSPLFGQKEAYGSEVDSGVFENNYTYFEYRRLLGEHFGSVKTVFRKAPPPASPRHRNGIKTLIRRFVPPWIIWAQQVVLRGSGNYTAICRVD
jgi:ubiquinone/menaquinone biosynthesis C-methylase UbiE